MDICGEIMEQNCEYETHKSLFVWDYQSNNNNWLSNVKFILDISHNIDNFNLKRECKINNVKKALTEQLFMNEWKQHMLKSL